MVRRTTDKASSPHRMDGAEPVNIIDKETETQ